MDLQITELKAPQEIDIEYNKRVRAHAVEIKYDGWFNDFTCYLNQAVPENINKLSFFLYIFYPSGKFFSMIELSVENKYIKDKNTNRPYFDFKLSLAYNVYPNVSELICYTTIKRRDKNKSIEAASKKVKLNYEEEFYSIYWSNTDKIKHAEFEQGILSEISGNNQTVYLHIKSTGINDKKVEIKLYAHGDKLIHTVENYSLSNDLLCIKFTKDQLIKYYKEKVDDNYNDNDISFILTATVNEEYKMFNSYNTLTSTGITVKGSKTNTVVEKTIPPTSTGQVKVVQKDNKPKNENSNIDTSKFTDFTIGSIVHIAGTGRARGKNDNTKEGTYHTVYPINVYEIMLSDLVAAGLVSIAEATYLTSADNKLRTRIDLENSFNKFNARLSSTKTIINVFQDIKNTNKDFQDRVNPSAVRTILSQVKHKKSKWENADDQEICRDAWQLISGSVNKKTGLRTVFNRSKHGRYDSSKECPPGEYFLTYIPPDANGSPTYRIFVSQTPKGQTIYTYPEKQIGDQSRTAIAIHRGGATAAIGCITFNVPYTDPKTLRSGNYDKFNETVFPSKNNNKHLNLICLDKRKAKQTQNDVQTVDRTSKKQPSNPKNLVTQNFWRWFDLTEPKDGK